MDWNYWLNVDVFVQLKSGRFYTGKVVEITTSNDNQFFLKLIDKFDRAVVFPVSEVEVIEDESGEKAKKKNAERLKREGEND